MFELSGGNFNFTPTAKLVRLYAKKEYINTNTKKNLRSESKCPFTRVNL